MSRLYVRVVNTLVNKKRMLCNILAALWCFLGCSFGKCGEARRFTITSKIAVVEGRAKSVWVDSSIQNETTFFLNTSYEQ